MANFPLVAGELLIHPGCGAEPISVCAQDPTEVEIRGAKLSETHPRYRHMSYMLLEDDPTLWLNRKKCQVLICVLSDYIKL